MNLNQHCEFESRSFDELQVGVPPARGPPGHGDAAAGGARHAVGAGGQPGRHPQHWGSLKCGVVGSLCSGCSRKPHNTWRGSFLNF